MHLLKLLLSTQNSLFAHLFRHTEEIFREALRHSRKVTVQGAKCTHRASSLIPQHSTFKLLLFFFKEYKLRTGSMPISPVLVCEASYWSGQHLEAGPFRPQAGQAMANRKPILVNFTASSHMLTASDADIRRNSIVRYYFSCGRRSYAVSFSILLTSVRLLTLVLCCIHESLYRSSFYK